MGDTLLWATSLAGSWLGERQFFGMRQMREGTAKDFVVVSPLHGGAEACAV